MKQNVIAVVTPVYNDWASLSELIHRLGPVSAGTGYRFHLLIIDDGSIQKENLARQWVQLGAIEQIEILQLYSNIGHQRAIAVGLAEVLNRHDLYDAALVMDADGEDRPEDMGELVRMHVCHPDCVIVAKRTKRSEERLFRLFYQMYKLFFKLSTGYHIDFGNFCLIPVEYLERIMYSSNTWNHLAASITRSKLPVVRIDADRGQRYAGQSQMNLETLIIHGLSAISVFADFLFVRVLLASLVVAFFALGGIAITVWIKLFTDLAIPGWATTTTSAFIIILSQALLFSSGSAFVILNSRTNSGIIPAIDTRRFIRGCQVIYRS